MIDLEVALASRNSYSRWWLEEVDRVNNIPTRANQGRMTACSHDEDSRLPVYDVRPTFPFVASCLPFRRDTLLQFVPYIFQPLPSTITTTIHYYHHVFLHHRFPSTRSTHRRFLQHGHEASEVLGGRLKEFVDKVSSSFVVSFVILSYTTSPVLKILF